MQKHTTMSRTRRSIPEEICYDILLRLPVKSVLAFKCVCKNWYALISTSDFVKQHHKLTLLQKSNPNPTLILKVYANQLYSVRCDSLLPSSTGEIKDDVVKRIHPFKSSLPRHWVAFLGSSNGIVCVWLASIRGDKDSFSLWNPATGEYRELPEPPIGFNVDSACIRGFGYDHKTDDYKLVLGVENPSISRLTIRVQVYTSASNSWRTEKTIPFRFTAAHRTGTLLNGNIHWLALHEDTNDHSVLYFDMDDESFKEFQLTQEICGLIGMDQCLGVLQGCLCLFIRFNGYGSEPNRTEVWEMLDYGVQESWTRRYLIAHESIINDQKYFRRVLSFEKDKILLLGANNVVLYDPKHESARELKIDNEEFTDAETCIDSLVSLNSGTYVAGERKRRLKK